MAAGGGGLVAGRFVLSYFFVAGAIGQGYATVTTDAGTSTDPATGLTELLLDPGNMNWNAVQNFGSRALNDESIITKQLAASFYGREPMYSYWSGLSQGGRQGLMLAQCYPTAYDGIVASAASKHTRNCETNALTDAAIAYCDAKDGVADGAISDTDGCDFDPFSMVGESFHCSDTGSTLQINHGAALVANETWAGPVTGDGTQLWYGFEKGALLAGTRGNAVGIASTECSSNGTCIGMTGNSGEGWLAYGAAKDPSFVPSDLTLDAYSWLMHDSETEWKSIWSTNEPDLSAFHNAGAKIMTYHGLAIQNIPPPRGTSDYHASFAKILPDVNDFSRAFEVPGLEQCSGGTGGQPTTIFDQMRDWVENDTVSETIPISFVNTKSETQNRILCPLPLKTTFNATCGDGARADCFYCAEK